MKILVTIMLLAVLLACISSVASKEIGAQCTTCVRVNNVCHNTTYLFTLPANFRETVVITQLGILRSKNVLYYAFEPNITYAEYYKIGYISLDNPIAAESGVITSASKKVNNFATFDFDQEKSKVYLGSSDGIGFLDVNGKAYLNSTREDTIRNLFFYNQNLFYLIRGQNMIVERDGNDFKTYDQCRNVRSFVIDKRNNLVFMNTSGLFVNRFRTNITEFLSKNNYFRGLTLDLEGTVYAWWIDGIYKVFIGVDLPDSKIEKVAELPGIGALTFDNGNNFIFTSGSDLFRLTQTNTTLC